VVGEEEEGEKVQESIARLFVCLFCGDKFKFGWPEL
jgi:hypothetical protein